MKYQPLIGTSMSGSLGGITASHNTYGSYFRKRVKPVQPRTPAQQAVRSAFTLVSQAYRTAGSRVTAAFTTAATTLTKSSKTGSKVTLTASALFQRVNVIRQRCGLPLLYDPPTTDTPPGFSDPVIHLFSDGTATVTFAMDEWNVAGGCVAIQISPPLTPGQTFNGRFTTYAAVANPGVTPVAETAAQTYPIGATAELQFIAETPDGRLSNRVRIPVVVEAAAATLISANVPAPGILVLTYNTPITAAAGPAIITPSVGPAYTAIDSGLGTTVITLSGGSLNTGNNVTAPGTDATTPPTLTATVTVT
jgi:hypothetical protein